MTFCMSKNIFWVPMAIILLVCPFAAKAQITVNSVTTIPTTCPNNGIISVTATTSNPPLLYSIITGPVTQPVQTNPVFSSLPAGNYVIRLTDGAGNQTTANTTIGGTYINPAFSITPTAPYCVGESNGQLVGNINPGTGTPPFLWQLVTPSPVTTAPQASSTFTGLPAGNYAMRVTDACGTISTDAFILQNPDTRFGFYLTAIGQQGTIIAEKIGCDSMQVTYWLGISNPRMPLTFEYHTSNGVFIPTSGTTIDSSNIHNGGAVMVRQIIPGMDYGDQVQAYIYNSCGDSAVSISIVTHPFIFYPKYSFNDCGNTANVVFTNTPYYEYHTSINTEANYTLTHVSTNTVVESGTIIEQLNQNNGYISIIPPVIPGETYHFSVTDGCGENFQSNFTVPGLAPPVIIWEFVASGACIDSVVGAYRINTEGFGPSAKLILLSGPATLGSTKPEFEYSDTYTYPDTVGFNGDGFILGNLSIGTYQYKIIDDCGNELFSSIVITPEQVTSLSRTNSREKGCPGHNKIFYSMINGGNVTIRNIATNAIVANRDFISYTDDTQASIYNKDSVLNLTYGSYEVTYQFLLAPGYYQADIANNDSDIPCSIIVDTVVIEPYQTPEMTAGNAIMCNNTINFVLIPDTGKGLAPYEYEIISGPQTFPVQNSNIFTITLPGTYTARILDACGNASIKQITVDTISFDPIEVNSTCNNTSLIFPSSMYDHYEWLMPNGQIHVGDSLIIDPITAADTGTYHIDKIVDINGCRDTLHTTYHVSLNIEHAQTIHFCEGSTVTIGTSTYTQPGIYSDTLAAAAGCDSILISNLVMVLQEADTVQISICSGDSLEIAGQFYDMPGFYTDSTQNQFGCYDLIVTHLLINNLIDTITAAICSGSSYNFGGTSYSSAGYYSDTLVSVNGCDSISVLHLTIELYMLNNATETICAGETFAFGGLSLNQTGIYTDTTSIGTCDTITTLTLTVLPYIHDSVHVDICMGSSYAFDGNLLTQAGVYTDTLSTINCDSIVTLTLSVLPYIYNTVSVSICAGEEYMLDGNPLSQTGTYVDTLSTNTCDSIVTLNLTVSPYKYHTFNQTICEEGNITFGGNIYNLPGTYRDTVSTSSCDSIVTLVLQVTPLSRTTINAHICAYQKYTLGDIHYVESGTYIQVFQTSACDSIVTLNLSVTPAPWVNITYNATGLVEGASVELHANSLSHPLTYLWTSNAILNNYTIQHPNTNIQEPTWVHVTVTDINGCTSNDSILISIPVIPTLYIPNTYTPNGDGTNEGFKVYGTHIGEFEMMIFNRWGELIFESNNIETGWNGTYMGQSVQNGLYVYKVVARGTDKTRLDRTGHVNVVR